MYPNLERERQMANFSCHPQTVTHTKIASPLGELTVVAEDHVVVDLYFPHGSEILRWPARPRPPRPGRGWYFYNRASFGARTDVGFEEVRRQLGEYFGGQREDFDLRLGPRGTDLQRRVWDLICQVRYGQTSTYGDLADQLGDGTSPRAVGAAVGSNRLCILIPCHRVVGHDGRLTGYAGGLRRKQALLNLEDVLSRVPTGRS
jgi:methylated-DNA-[protein]-cysteine S-methyltransferase